MVELVASLPRVASRFGMTSRTHHGDSKRRKGVAKRGRFTGTQHDPHLRKRKSQGAEELGEVTILEWKARLKLPGGRAQARHAHGELGSPTDTLEMEQMGGQRSRLPPPIGESEQNADSDPSKSSLMSPLGSIETPVKILLGAGKMQFPISLPIVSLLIDHKPLGTSGDERYIVRGLHRGHFQRETGNLPMQTLDASLEILSRDEFGMLSRDEQDVAESLGRKMPGLGRDLLNL